MPEEFRVGVLQNREMHKAFWDGLLTEKHFNSFLVSSGRTAADDDSDPDISSAAAEFKFSVSCRERRCQSNWQAK